MGKSSLLCIFKSHPDVYVQYQLTVEARGVIQMLETRGFLEGLTL